MNKIFLYYILWGRGVGNMCNIEFEPVNIRKELDVLNDDFDADDLFMDIINHRDDVEKVLKVSQGSPNIKDAILNNEVDWRVLGSGMIGLNLNILKSLKMIVLKDYPKRILRKEIGIIFIQLKNAIMLMRIAQKM